MEGFIGFILFIILLIGFWRIEISVLKMREILERIEANGTKINDHEEKK